MANVKLANMFMLLVVALKVIMRRAAVEY